MSSLNDCFYWVGGANPYLFAFSDVNHIQSVNDIPDGAAGAVCFDFDDEDELQHALKLFLSKPYRWSWCIFTTKRRNFQHVLLMISLKKSLRFDYGKKSKKI
ncbi:hypothetical protein PCI56_01735 [Plesiomonas shigelloides subsp. oncorhynchi]|nr:hypothetical protein [Plesiomonas shigelloides]